MADLQRPPFLSMVDVSIQHRQPPHDGRVRPRKSTTPTTTKPTLAPLIDASKVTENLFTKEDPYHVHKTLGFLSLLSFMVRLCFVGEADMGFARFPWLTLPTVALHMSLGLSSLFFKIPGRRISEGNRIWPQFRLHSNCFVARHSLLIVLYWAERHVFHGAPPVYWANSVIVFFNLLCVDAVNATVQDRSNSVRDLQAHPAAKYFFTAMQFAAMTHCIAGTRRASLHYYVILVMQLTAFMATLRRKNVFVGARGRRMLVFGYGTMLAIGVVLGLFDYGVYSTLHELALLTAVTRVVHLIRVGGPQWLGILKSRYMLWGAAALFLNLARSSGPNVHPFGLWLAEPSQTRIVRMVSFGLLVLQVSYGFVVTKRQLLKQQASTTKSKAKPPNEPTVMKEELVVDTSKVAENLFTKEDPYHVHKTLGFLSILSFVVRLYFIGSRDMGFQSFPMLTLPTIALHMTLGLSALFFKIPSRRISEGNRIWPQFRLHSNCFVIRHSLMIILYWAEQHVFHCAPVYWANSAIAFFNLLCVDAVNAMVKDRSNTIRDLQAHPAAKYFFTAMQFAAMTHCIAGSRRSSLHYYIILVVQLTAFMGTLRRKNVLVGAGGRRLFVFGYGALLGIGVVLGLFDYGVYTSFTFHEMALVMAVNRTVHIIRVGGPQWLGILKSRYMLWGAAALFLNLARPSGPNVHPFGLWLAEESQSRIIRVVSLGLLVLQVSYGFVVTKRQLLEQQASTNKCKTNPRQQPTVVIKEPVVDTSKVAENLFTKEDPYHVHKTLGFLSILSFVVRLYFIGSRDMGFQSFPMLTLPTIALHMTLGLSALFFKIPSRRISEGNRIWPQFRLHSVCFVARHSLLILLYWAESYVFHCDPIYWANGLICFVNLLCVDAVNATVKDRSNSVRDLQAHPAAKYFFTAMQFGAMAHCIAGTRRASLHYYIILVMQLSAFGTTLRRKNIIAGANGRRALVFGYGMMLAIGFVLFLGDYAVYGTLHELALVTAVARSVHLIRVGGPEWLGMLRSKYILWGVAAVFLRMAQPKSHPFGVWLAEEPQSRVLRTVSLGLLALQISYGFVVTNRQLQAQQASATKAKTA